ncbi:MAG TPA: cytochrome b/b6 domain-containing protein [Burkholderiaceae bacterium]|nr:cytochrome b/b6 domain-containing protein [Burkholderiaceae bacterium]
MKNIRIWDLATRSFHWLLVFSIIGLIITGNVGGNAMVWHFRLGNVVFTLLLFRIIWGLIGGHWSRFSSFIYSPKSIIQYLKGDHPKHHAIGHNPMGALSVFALLLTLAAQVATGLFSDDEIAAVGPLAKHVSNATVSQASFYHTEIGKLLIILLVVFHIGAILFYLFKKRENLVKPMIHGDKFVDTDTPPSRDDGRMRLLALITLLACGLVVYLTVS